MSEYKRSMGSIYLYSNNIKARASMQNRRISMQIRQTPDGGKESGKQSKPACGSVRLNETKDSVTCPDCGKVYPIVDGIYNFRLE